MENKLIKEIITTTTEKYGEGGSVIEKITETREKVYQDSQQIAPPINEVATEELDEQLIQQASRAINETGTYNDPPQPVYTPIQPQQYYPEPPRPAAPKYKVTSRANSGKMPWENQ